jgi:hypothetical protein
MEEHLETSAKNWKKFLRAQGSISTEIPQSELKLSRTKTWDEYIHLVLIHHFLEDEETKWVVKAELLGRVSDYGVEKRQIAQICLNSKPEMILYLLECSYLFATPREFFGFLIMKRRTLERYNLHMVYQRKKKQSERIRGYRDHGSRKPDHLWKETRDVSFTELQNKKEILEDLIVDTYSILEGGIS